MQPFSTLLFGQSNPDTASKRMQRLLRSIALEVGTAPNRASVCISTNARTSAEGNAWDRMHVIPQINRCKGFFGVWLLKSEQHTIEQ